MKIAKIVVFVLIVAAGFAFGSAWVEMHPIVSLPLSFIVGGLAALYAMGKFA